MADSSERIAERSPGKELSDKTAARWLKVWLVPAMAVLVAPYAFVFIYASLSGTLAPHALDTFRASVGEIYTVLFLVNIIGYCRGRYPARKKPAQIVPQSEAP